MKQKIISPKKKLNTQNKLAKENKYFLKHNQKSNSTDEYYKFTNKKKLRNSEPKCLDSLARQFIEYVYNSNSSIIEINNVVEKLKIKKRRIYDIINVLEGKKLLLFN